MIAFSCCLRDDSSVVDAGEKTPTVAVMRHDPSLIASRQRDAMVCVAELYLDFTPALVLCESDGASITLVVLLYDLSLSLITRHVDTHGGHHIARWSRHAGLTLEGFHHVLEQPEVNVVVVQLVVAT